MKRARKKQETQPCPLGRIYVAGPMSGYPDHNFPAFNEAARRLRLAGYDVVNPAELDDGDATQPWEYYLKRDLAQMVTCEGIALLDGWENSRGARLEVSTARALSIEVTRYQPHADDGFTLAPLDDTILDEAKRLVSGDRNQDYGHPLDDFARSAAIWSALLGCRVTPEQVGLCMIGVKLSRHCHAPKRDNLVDAAGYARTIEMIGEEKERRRDFELEIKMQCQVPGMPRPKRAS